MRNPAPENKDRIKESARWLHLERYARSQFTQVLGYAGGSRRNSGERKIKLPAPDRPVRSCATDSHSGPCGKNENAIIRTMNHTSNNGRG